MLQDRVPFRFVRNSTLHIASVTAIQAFLFVLSAIGAFLLRFEFAIPRQQLRNLLIGIAVWVVVKSIVTHLWQLDRSAWRFASLLDMRNLVLMHFLGGSVSALIIVLLAQTRFPLSIYLLDFALSLLFTAGARLAARTLFESNDRNLRRDSKAAFIYGAGGAGIALLREVRSNPALDYTIQGFIDDDVKKEHMLIHGLPVVGAGQDLPSLAPKYGVVMILIAIPSATGEQMIRILDHCAKARVSFRTIPSLSEMMNNASIKQPIRDVAVDDLLGRKPVQIEEQKVDDQLSGQVILVTGAAGSIGSELIRQIARFGPKLIIGLDVAETPLFHIEREIRKTFAGIAFEPVVASIQNRGRLREVFRRFEPVVVFHAAAYKHVPMMEANIFEAVENNILGTYNVAAEASRAHVRAFVMISSDKAVRPTSIMGLTKRVAEMIVSSISYDGGKFVSVRFGNVLGSNGSVVPIFREQIAAGGPVTVTHREMRRFFMTIPEAVQLVLQASCMGKGREIFVLDMGEPVKIVDLARNLILLSGLRPDEDISIVFTGVRPGEKLYEELNTIEETTCSTYHEKIKIFSGSSYVGQLETWIRTIRQLCKARDLKLVLCLKELVNDYSPSADVLRCMLKHEDSRSISKPEVATPNYRVASMH